MRNPILETILSNQPAIRDRTLEELLDPLSPQELTVSLLDLQEFRKKSNNNYHQVRACLFSFAICRFYLLDPESQDRPGKISSAINEKLNLGNYSESLRLLHRQLLTNPSDACLSAIAQAAYKHAFELLLTQVKKSIQDIPENEWLFKISGLQDYPLQAAREYLTPDSRTGNYPMAVQFSPVRIDPCHSGWSDIFLVAMDFPQGAKVINISVDIAPRGKNKTHPPVECYCRVISEPILRLASIDLNCRSDIHNLHSLFDFKADHLALLKAGIIASGIVPPGWEKKKIPLKKILEHLLGKGLGLEVVTRVRNLPPGSRLAVSTALLNSVITGLMRLSGQIAQSRGELNDQERELVAGRTILGEWLGGSGGGWQDSGGLWPGIKILEGVESDSGDPEHPYSRGRILPQVKCFKTSELAPNIKKALSQGLVLFHSGQARNVGPILEMVTEKYLLRYRREWEARLREINFFKKIVRALKQGNLKKLGWALEQDWLKGTKVIIPAASDPFTEDLIQTMKARWEKQYLGFLMLGGAAGGGMAFVIEPDIHQEFSRDLILQMRRLRKLYDGALPFMMEPTLFNFELNNLGIRGEIWKGAKAILPRPISPSICSPKLKEAQIKATGQKFGYNQTQQTKLRRQYQHGEVGLKKNRLPLSSKIDDVKKTSLLTISSGKTQEEKKLSQLGKLAISKGQIGIVTLAGGMGSRWFGGSGGIKALAPLTVIQGKFRNFLEIHLAKSKLLQKSVKFAPPHIFTTSFLTHPAILKTLQEHKNYGYPGTLLLSLTPFLSRRLVPSREDLKVYREKKLAPIHDTDARRHEKGRLEAIELKARKRGEGKNYSFNQVLNLFHPPGHWYEFPGMIRNGTLGKLLKKHPDIRYLLMHNLDAVGTGIDELLLGLHIAGQATCSFEVTPKWWGDRGGFLARVNGKTRLVEAMALPRDSDQQQLSYYNSLTCWISVDSFLSFLNLSREDILAADKNKTQKIKIEKALAAMEEQMPTYAALKEVQESWGPGRQEVFPVIQAEKLWGDISALEDLSCAYIPVGRRRAQQLKDPSGLDHWIRDGSRDYLESLCLFTDR